MTERQVVQLPVTFDSANRKKDRSLALRLTTTQEIPNGEFAVVDQFVGTNGYFLFSQNAFDDADIPKEDAPNDSKSPSQRLRAVLFVLFQKEGDGEDFDIFYRRKMNGIIDRMKDRLADYD